MGGFLPGSRGLPVWKFGAFVPISEKGK